MSPSAPTPAAKLVSIHVGKAAPLGPDGQYSAFVKTAIPGPVEVGALGLAGDQQVDLSVHGGPDMAVYGYAARHYAAWGAEHPELADMLAPGSFGENLAIDGFEEADLCVGDVHAVGGALLQACQPRQPCQKLAYRFGEPRLVKEMVRNGRSGWYYRVLQAGRISPGDAVRLHARPHPDFPFARLVEIVNHGAEAHEWRALADMEGLAAKLRAKAANNS